MCSELVPMSIAAIRMNPWVNAVSAIMAVSAILQFAGHLLSCPVSPSVTTCFARDSNDLRKMLHEMEEGGVRAVHQARVASRRLRELLPVLQLDPDVLRKLSRRLRKITGRLGTVRELDVLAGVLDELGKAGRHPQQALAQVAATIDEERRPEAGTASGERPAPGTAAGG